MGKEEKRERKHVQCHVLALSSTSSTGEAKASTVAGDGVKAEDTGTVPATAYEESLGSGCFLESLWDVAEAVAGAGTSPPHLLPQCGALVPLLGVTAGWHWRSRKMLWHGGSPRDDGS